MKKAFTLIELLVVVLIIGILAAVALPQYRHAVEKSRLATLFPLVKSIVNAKNEHFLATGEYARTFDVLSVDLPSNFQVRDDSYYGQAAAKGNGEMEIYLDSGSHRVAGVLTLSDSSRLWFYIAPDYNQLCIAGGGVGTRADQLCKSLPGATFQYLSDINPVYTIKY